MKKRRSVLIAVILIAGITALYSVVVRFQSVSAPEIVGPRFISAMVSYARDLKSQGKPVPNVISLRDLVAGGYITTGQTGIFSNLDVSISTKADDTHPQMFLAWVRLPDGTYNVALADGSVQQFPAAVAAAEISRQQRPDGGVNQ